MGGGKQFKSKVLKMAMYDPSNVEMLGVERCR